GFRRQRRAPRPLRGNAGQGARQRQPERPGRRAGGVADPARAREPHARAHEPTLVRARHAPAPRRARAEPQTRARSVLRLRPLVEGLVERMKQTKLVGAQRTIASYLTQDLNRTAFLSRAEIAAECRVSVSAVTRFAQKLGYEGFPELKKELEELYRK